ncbi:Uncharacterised protein [Enterobacter hormaechei]|uniref:hypothetical protein n=1 Tax=Enterobacter hormaechei TaxID=158836 RepID=UPI000795B48F|nr:hypothetical protein [Enterobacter hormaechei]CZX56846.1 Uncharacterised protein [Enterobacter hormaechei]SMF75861.1 hypothetical protein SAMN04487932_0161 [Enterobacter hormaechei]
MSNIDKRATELLIENGELVADTLRHLADNEIDSDYFAICHTNENGTEIECELAITDYARQAAGTVDELVKALEAAEKRIAELSQKADIYDMLRQDYELHGSLVDFVDWQAKRIAELEASHGNLREAVAGIHNTIRGEGAYTPLAAILNASKRAYEESASAAGKGEA